MEKKTQATLEAKETLSRGFDSFRRNAGPFVKANPYLTLGAAAVTGFVVSKLISPRK